MADEERAHTSLPPHRALPTYTATLDQFVAATAGDDGVRIDRLEPLTELVVRTWHSTYEILVADPQRSRVIVRGGQNFPVPTPATLRGSTLGGHCLKIGWIGAGFNMEIQAGGVVAVTSPVQTIQLAGPSPDRSQASEEDTDATTDAPVSGSARRSRAERSGFNRLRVEH